MTNSSAVPAWVEKVTGPKRKRSVVCKQMICVKHPIEFASETVTFRDFRSQVWSATSKLATKLESHDLPESIKRCVLTNVFDTLDDLGPKLWLQVCAEAEREFSQSDRVVELDVGPVTYQLRCPLKAHIAPLPDHEWEFALDKFAPRFMGKSDSIAAARRDFLNKVHTSFQSLVRRRPFQMSDVQNADWQVLEDLIDVDTYWDTVPVALLETGVISAISATGREVVWLDGERREFIPIERTLPEFAAFEDGQWFEALVERKPRTYQFQRLQYVRPIEPIRAMSECEFRQWVNGLPPGDDVFSSGTDWATL